MSLTLETTSSRLSIVLCTRLRYMSMLVDVHVRSVMPGAITISSSAR